ncbi:MAG: glycosyltransferase family 39 protein [Aggregatilineales bacterium]
MRRLVRLLENIDWYIIAALSSALPLIIPFLQSGLPKTADAESHTLRIVSVLVNLENGYWWPRWTPFLAGQYGYPLHNFHPPGTYIVEALVYLLTHANPAGIFMAAQVIVTLLYPLGAYRFARTFVGRPGALVAAVAYTYLPFRFRELWIQSDLPQFVAMMLLPWLLWTMSRTAQRKNARWVALTGAILAGLVLSHHSTTYLAVPVVVAYLFLLLYEEYRTGGFRTARQAAVALVGGLLLGIALSAVYWLPALAELPYIQINTIQGPLFDPLQNFIPSSLLLSGVTPIDRALLNWRLTNGLEGLRAGLPQVVAMVLGLLVLLPSFRCSFGVKWRVLLGAIGGAICLFLITPASANLWLVIPLARQVQFPARLLGDVGVLIIPGVAALPSLVSARWRTWIAGGLVLIFFGSTLPLLYAPLEFHDVPLPSPASEVAHEIQSGDIATTTANEYLPRWVTVQPTGGFQTAILRDQAANALQTLGWNVWIDDSSLPNGALINPEISQQAGTNRYRVQTPIAFTLRFHQLYFPGWQVQIDGNDAKLGQSEPNGLITVPISVGEHEISIGYAGTSVQHIADLISLVALVVWFSLLLTLRFRPKIRSRRRVMPSQRFALTISIASVLFVAFNQAVLIPSTNLFRPRTILPNVPASVRLNNVVFGGALELLGYDLDSSVVASGQTVHIRLYWGELHKTDLSLSGAVTLTSADGKQVWGKIEAFNLGQLNNTRDWPDTSVYVADEYFVPVVPDAPPFIASVRVTVFLQAFAPLQYLQTADGSHDYALTTIRIIGNFRSIADSQIRAVNADFGDAVTLAGYRLWRDGSGQECLGLRWQVHSTPPTAQVMIHFMDSQGSTLGVADSPPLNGLYPTSSWQSGQILDDVHCFSLPPATASIALGLYTLPDVARLSVKSADGTVLPDNQLLIGITNTQAQ